MKVYTYYEYLESPLSEKYRERGRQCAKEKIRLFNPSKTKDLWDDRIYYTDYIGKVFSLYPSGKYYTPFARSNVTDTEGARDQAFKEGMEEVLDPLNFWIESGEGDPTDVYLCCSQDTYNEWLIRPWKYVGDVNLEYGGAFFKMDVDDLRYGYCEAIIVTDLESATGADGLTLIEKRTIYGIDNKTKIKQALQCHGLTLEDLRGKGKDNILLILVECLHGYGFSDPQGYPPHWIVVNDNYGPLSDKSRWDSWKIDINETVNLHHNYNGNLRDYIIHEVLNRITF